MEELKNEQAYLKLAQLLASSDSSSTLNLKYVEQILYKEGNINFQISADTVLGSTKPELLGCTILHIAYKQNKIDLFRLLLAYGADFNVRNEKGSTILHQIVEDTYVKEAESSILESISNNPFVTSILDVLVKSEDYSNALDEKYITHFHIACMANHAAAVEHFLKTEVLIDLPVIQDSPIFAGYTVVHFAARFTNLDTIKLLLEYGAVHNIKDAKEMTPLHILLQQNIEIADLLNKNEVENAEQLISRRKTNEVMICLLLNRSPEQTDIIDDTNLTRLHIACIMESLKITDDLLEDAVYINQSVNAGSLLFLGNTALHFAAICNVEKLKLLLIKGANIHLQNAKNQTAFDLCVERYEVKDICDIIATQPNWSTAKLSIPGKTVLDMISSLQTQDISAFIANQSFMINATVNHKSSLWPSYSLIHVAVIFSERYCRNDSMVIEKVMQQALPISLSQIAKFGISPLHLAFRLKKEKVVNFLLRSCRSAIDCIDNDKLSHLHIACAAGVSTAVEKFLLTGADVNAQVQSSFEWYRYSQSLTDNSNVPQQAYISKGSTPLHVAVIVGNCEVVKVLLEHGADRYAQDEHGMTPIHWLIASDNPISPAADILLSASKPVSTILSPTNNKRLAASFILEECVTSTGLSHLHVACFANNKIAVKQLLEENSSKINDISLCTGDNDAKRFPGQHRYAGFTPLHFALERKSEKIISLLVKHKANVLMYNPIRNSNPLYEAFNDKMSPCSEVIISSFKNNKVLQEQLEQALGLTMLHFYCYLLNYKAAETILNKGAVDVNKSIVMDSVVWPGFTPLHVLMKFYKSFNRDADALLRLLLDFGADVTALNAEKNTPLHLAYDLGVETGLKITVLKCLLRNQKNYGLNLYSDRGLSHFHVACALNDVVKIEKFLKDGVDVNQPIDLFYGDAEFNGCTPLHLILYHPFNKNVDIITKFTAVRLLTDYGADVRAENAFGNTILHLAVQYYSKYLNLFTKIVLCGGDIYAKNVLAETPFEIMLNLKDVTVGGVLFFLDRGYSANAFNPITQKGFIAMTFSSHSCTSFEKLRPVFETMMKACSNTLDETGRTVIHNIVSTSTPVFSRRFYITVIESCLKIVDIDHQDNQGRTALHIATEFKNHRAVFALLQSGADINITDANNKTPFVYAFENSLNCEGSQDDIAKVVKFFSRYIQKLNACDLAVHETNQNALREAIKKYNVDVNPTPRFHDELNQMKKMRLTSTSVTLMNIISGINAGSVNSFMSRLEPTLFENLFEKVDKERFYESLGIVRLQCRKFLKKNF